MALVFFGLCDPADGVDIGLDYDDGTLDVVNIHYGNATDQDALLTLTVAGTDNNFTLPANSPPDSTEDITSLGLVMVHTTPPKGDPSIGLQSDTEVGCGWPA